MVGDFTGSKTFEEWKDVYERRAGDDVHFQLVPDEQIFYNSDHGFFTWWVDHKKKRLVIPKMVGNGKFLRHVIFDMVKALEPLGFREILCCSRRRPEVYLRVLGGKLDHIETSININTGKEEPMYFYVVSLDDTKEALKNDDKTDKP